MKIFFDTEFYEDGRAINLISIGMVREDGEAYYAETMQADALATSSPWLIENVLPHLKGFETRRPTSMIADELVAFVGEKPEFWAYYADYDWVALCQIFGTMMQLPKGWPMYCRDIKQLADMLGNPLLPQHEEADVGGMHDALADARWNKIAFNYLRRLSSTSRLLQFPL